jgi:DNA-packaging protein gp3
MNKGRPLLFKSKEELETKIEEYFKSCYDYKRDMFGGRIEDKVCVSEVEGEDGKIHRKWESKGFVMEQVKPFTVSGLAVYLGTSRETLMNYEKKEEYFDTIKAAKDRIYAYTEESLFNSKATGPIFSLKNNYGWVDKQEIDNNVKVEHSPIEELLNSIDAIKK